MTSNKTHHIPFPKTVTLIKDMTEASTSTQELTNSDFRITKIMEIKDSLEFNIQNRRRLKKMYSRATEVINISDGIASIVTAGLSISGLGLLTTIVAIPAVLVLESASLGFGLLSVILKVVNKKLRLKEQKHQKILSLAESKLNTLYDLISKSISDGNISEEEFTFILAEEEKFRIMKEEIRNNIDKKIYDNERDSLIVKGKDEIRAKIITVLTPRPSNVLKSKRKKSR